MKRFLILLAFFASIFAIFIVIETYRIKGTSTDPLIIIEKDDCNEDKYSCYGIDDKYEEVFISFGYTLKNEYYRDPSSTKKKLSYHLVRQDFYLFNRFLIWGWIE